MLSLRPFMGPVLLMVAGLGAARAEENRVVVPGQPPLSQDMVDDYAKFLEWRLGPAVARAGGTERLRQMIVNDWQNGDARRRQAFLTVLKWWREDFPKLSKEERQRLPASNTMSTQDLERMRSSANFQAVSKEQRLGASADDAGFVNRAGRTVNAHPLPAVDADGGQRPATVECDAAGGRHAQGTCSGPYGFGHQFVAQMGCALGQ